MMYQLTIKFETGTVIIKTSHIQLIEHFIHECIECNVKTFKLKEIKN